MGELGHELLKEHSYESEFGFDELPDFFESLETLDINEYGFALNDPLSNFDVLGENPVTICSRSAAAVAAAIRAAIAARKAINNYRKGMVAYCDSLHKSYTATEKFGCPKGLPCEAYDPLIIQLKVQVLLRKQYLDADCDKWLTRSRKGSKKQQKGNAEAARKAHEGQLAEKQRAVENCKEEKIKACKCPTGDCDD